jgi:shikimate kinase
MIFLESGAARLGSGLSGKGPSLAVLTQSCVVTAFTSV